MNFIVFSLEIKTILLLCSLKKKLEIRLQNARAHDNFYFIFYKYVMRLAV